MSIQYRELTNAACEIFRDGCEKMTAKLKECIEVLSDVPAGIGGLADFVSKAREHLDDNDEAQRNAISEIESTRTLWMLLRYIAELSRMMLVTTLLVLSL